MYYGMEYLRQTPHDMPRPWSTYGVPAEAVSSGTKYEGPDPHYWCHYGYAVANVDPRGCGHSEGEMQSGVTPRPRTVRMSSNGWHSVNGVTEKLEWQETPCWL